MDRLQALLQWIQSSHRKAVLVTAVGIIVLGVSVLLNVSVWMESLRPLSDFSVRAQMSVTGPTEKHIYRRLVEGDDKFSRGQYDAALVDYRDAQRYINSLRQYYGSETRGIELKATGLVIDNRVLAVTAAQKLREL